MTYIEDRIKDLESRSTSMSARIVDLEEYRDSSNEDLNDLEDKVKDLEQKASAIGNTGIWKTEFDMLKEKIKDLEEWNGQLQRSVASIDGRTHDLEEWKLNYHTPPVKNVVKNLETEYKFVDKKVWEEIKQCVSGMDNLANPRSLLYKLNELLKKAEGGET